MNTQLFIRFRYKPTNDNDKEVTFIELGGMWVRVYKEVKLMGVDFISEVSWEKNWFERNPQIYEMIKTNDKVLAKETINHKNQSIAFLAKEILDGNYISIGEDDKIFFAKDD